MPPTGPAGAPASGAPNADPLRVAYIAGCSYSGTTLMGFLLGSHPRAFFAGEVNQFNRRVPADELSVYRRVCACGEPYERCAVWGPVRERASEPVDLNPSPGVSGANLALVARALGPLPLPAPPPYAAAYLALLRAVRDSVRERTPELEWVVDSSKTLSGLTALAGAPGVELRVIHVIRDGRGVVASYARRGKRRGYAAGAWALANVSLGAYLRRSGLPVQRVDYGRLCARPEAELARLGDFLGLALDARDLAATVAAREYHPYGGNANVRTSIPTFEGIRYRPPVPTAAVERLLAGVLLNPLNRVFGVERSPSRG